VGLVIVVVTMVVTGSGVGGVGVAGWDASAAGHRRSHRAREGSGACQGLWGCRGWVWVGSYTLLGPEKTSAG
jgi:hypothetical protein